MTNNQRTSCRFMMSLYLRQKNCFAEMIRDYFEMCEVDQLTSRTNGKSYYVISPIYMEICQRIATVDEYMVQRRDGMYLELQDKALWKYFNKGFSEKQFFCVMFAYWYGLPINQIKLLSNKNNCKICERLLAYFLCNPQSQIETRREAMDEVEKGCSDLRKTLFLFENSANIYSTDVPPYKTVYRVSNSAGYDIYFDIDTNEYFFDADAGDLPE